MKGTPMPLRFCFSLLITLCAFASTTFAQGNSYDLIIRNGTVYDGSGRAPRNVDVAIRGDKIVTLGNLKNATPHTFERFHMRCCFTALGRKQCRTHIAANFFRKLLQVLPGISEPDNRPHLKRHGIP